jgi:hypothetical protein
MKESKEVAKALAAAGAEDGHKAFRASQFTNCEPMASLFEQREMVQCSLLIGRIAFDGISDDYSVEKINHL